MNRFPEGASPGDRAGDHLANERTYLAWLRTGLSMAALGVAVAKFAPGRGMHAVISGIILLLAGLMLIFYGTSRYRTVRQQLIENLGRRPPDLSVGLAHPSTLQIIR